MKRGRSKSLGFTQWKRHEHDGGYEYWGFASLRARRIWNHVLSVGETTWRRGQRHSHPFPKSHPFEDEGYILHFILEGELQHRIRSRRFVARRNDAVLMRAADGVEYGNESSKPARFYWVLFNGKQIPEVFTDLDAESQPLFRGVDRRRTERLFRELIRVIAHEPPGYEAELSALLLSVLARLYAVRPPELPLPETRTDLAKVSEPVRHAIRTLTHFYTEPLPVKALSDPVGLSVPYFQRLFRRETGYTPLQYLNQYRIEQAKMLLAETKDSVEAIARQVGIPNEKYFARLFRQINGMSPRQHRARAVRLASAK
jgi:AraC-like DNA-binding protein